MRAPGRPRRAGARLLVACAAGLVVLATRAAGAQEAPAAPHLRPHGTATQLVVDGAPFLVLGGELGNSSAASADTLRAVWPRLTALGLNTVLAPVYWELMEPEEGRFDFALVDTLLHGARRHGLRLVLLWFGSWKNSMSTYVPAWVKTDQTRFPRAAGRDGRGLEILSPFAPSNRDADARAFAALMRHLRAVDGAAHTVVMVQVENEIGMIPEAREHSPLADAAFAQPVPRALTAYLEAHRATLAPELLAAWEQTGFATDGDWNAVFGEGPHTEELFMAWHFARYVEHVAAAGKSAYPLPLFVNAALIRPGHAPGRYPSAGPLPHLLDVWRAAAPSLDFLAPDIYFPNFVEWTSRYAQPGNPLFVPEAGRAGAPEAPADAFFAVGELNAIGYSPFSIESIERPAADPLGGAYDLLARLAPLLLAHQGQGTLAGVRPPVAFDGTVDEAPQRRTLGGYTLTVSFRDPWTPAAEQRLATHGGVLVALAEGDYLIAGSGIVVTFTPEGPGGASAGLLSVQEGRYEAERWVGGRWLNGDQTHQGRHVRLPPGTFGLQRVRLYRYH